MITNLKRDLIILVIVSILCYFGYNEIRFARIEKSIVTTSEKIGQLDNIDLIVTRLVQGVMNKLIDQNLVVQEIDKRLDKKIDSIPAKIRTDKILLERKLQMINVSIVNATIGATGSGVTLKYNGKFYILSAGHMLDNPEDKLVLMENSNIICDLEVVKHIFTLFDGIGKEETKGIDLLLLRPKDKNIVPRVYVELAENELPSGSEIYIVGNPLGIEDVISEGRIIDYKNNYLLFIDHSYFGNSGGGLYNKDGKLVGINSFLTAPQPYDNFPAYMIGGAMRLNVIKDFLKDVE